MFKIPRIIVYVLMIGGCIALIPPLVFARMRATPSPNRPIHIFWDMDFQPKFKAQAPNPLFADGRAMRPPVQGSVARGESYVDTHMFEGVVDGQWATALPTSMKLDQATLERGQQRFNIYCSACHGYAGYGDGAVNQRAMELVSNVNGPVNGTQWVAAKSGATREVVNPANNEVIGLATDSGAADAEDAIAGQSKGSGLFDRSGAWIRLVVFWIAEPIHAQTAPRR